MKRVVIVRHAKAVPHGYDEDFHRELRESGKIDADLISRELKNQKISPDIMISSPANRALTTAEIFAENLGYERSNIRKVEDIYEGLTGSEFLEMIHTLPKDSKTAFFFGHNPDFHLFVQFLLTRFNQEMPTCATVGIDFDVQQWDHVMPRTGILAFRFVPNMFR
jgi:phosphohistidine phosphatase